MNRILILLASLLVAAPALALYEANGTVFDEQEREHYIVHKCFYDELCCALAISKDGSFGTATHNHPESAKYNALLQCRRIASKPETCEIVDVNAESDFIKSGISKPPRAKPAPSPTPSTDSGGESETAPTLVAKPNEAEEPVTTLKQKLLLLRSLVEEGLITEEDYNHAKKKILDKM